MNPTRGILFKVTALLMLSMVSAFVKAASDQVPPWQAIFFRSFFSIPVILLWLAMRRELSTGLKTKNPMGHLWRGLFGTTAMGCMFVALGLIPLPEVRAIGFATPIFTVFLAAIFLGERLRVFRITALAVGLIGVLIIIYPRLSLLQPGSVETYLLIGAGFALFSAIVRSMVQIHIRKLVQNETTGAVTFYFMLTATTLSLFTIPFGWVVPTAENLFYLVMSGIVGGVGQILITTSYRYAGAATLAPFDYIQMIYALLIGYFIFAEIPTVFMLAGAGIVICASAAITWRERQLGLMRGKTPPDPNNRA